jgi:hypothetical protein
MSTFLLFSADKELYDSLRDRYLFTKDINLGWIKHPAMRADSDKVHDASLIIKGYEDISSVINNTTAKDPRQLRRSVGIVDLRAHQFHGLSCLTPLSGTDSSWVVIVSMLMLAFPEIHWIFFGCDVSKLERLSSSFMRTYLYSETSDIASDCREAGFVPLFDGGGLRALIRQELRCPTVDGNIPLSYISVRTAIAASIDDEQPFAYFNAHAAYRFGYRCHVIESYKALESIFGIQGSSEHIRLTFEDLSLNFADKPPEKHLFLLDDRDKEFPLLPKADVRIFVTVGAGDELEQERLNDLYVKYQNDRSVGRMRTVYKPFSGFFDLWLQAGLYDPQVRHSDLLVEDSARAQRQELCESATIHGLLRPLLPHGVPGRMVLIVERLIERSEAILETGSSVQDYIHGAVLAIDAFELAGNRTPTLAIEALAVKHRLELSAECRFYGLRSNLEIDRRLDEIHGDVEAIGTRFQPTTREAAELETEINIINQLVNILRESGRFDEEQACMARLRSRRRSLWLIKKGRMRPIYALGWPVRWYAETLIHSPVIFFFAVLGWLIAATIFYLFATGIESARTKDFSIITAIGVAFFHAVENFVSAHPPDAVHDLLRAPDHSGHVHFLVTLWVIPVLMIMGFFHVGILVAYLYSVIARKVG